MGGKSILIINSYTTKDNLTFPHFVLHSNLLRNGFESLIISATGDYISDNVKYLKSIRPFLDFSRILRKLLFGLLDKKNNYYYYPDWNADLVSFKNMIKLIEGKLKPDIICVFWGKFHFNFKLMNRLSKHFSAPVLYFPMDMALYTGGCHYTNGCQKYTTGCGNCPAIKSKKANDMSFKTILKRISEIEKMNAYIAYANSDQLKQLNSSKFGNLVKFEMIPAVDERLFFPKPKYNSNLSNSRDKKVVLFGAASIKLERKGLKYFIDSLVEMDKTFDGKNDPLVMFMGDNSERFLPSNFPFEYEFLGYLDSEEMAIKFRNCHVYVNTSIEDAGPMMVNFAVMTGKPVIAFETGVVNDLVVHNETGIIVEPRNTLALAKGIDYILNLEQHDYSLMCQRARNIAITKISTKVQIERFIHISNSML